MKHALDMQPDNAKWLSGMAETKCRLGDTKVHTVCRLRSGRSKLTTQGPCVCICWLLLTLGMRRAEAHKSMNARLRARWRVKLPINISYVTELCGCRDTAKALCTPRRMWTYGAPMRQ